MPVPKKSLPLIEDCDGCGVCCLHMGYPAFMLPRDKATRQQIDSDAKWQAMLKQGWRRQELLDGHDGESYWHNLPETLKDEWWEFVDTYRRPGELDGPCFWLDMETRKCKHHDFRPRVCRDLEIGSQLCRQWRAHYQHLIHNRTV